MSEKDKPVPFGRPPEYEPWMCDKAIELGKLGKSVTAIANALGIAKSTLYVWMESNPHFSDAIEQARGAAQEYFEDIGNKYMVEEPGGAKLNTAWATFQMKNRFRDVYGDQPQVIINKTDDTKLNSEIKDKLDALESKIRDGGK